MLPVTDTRTGAVLAAPGSMPDPPTWEVPMAMLAAVLADGVDGAKAMAAAGAAAVRSRETLVSETETAGSAVRVVGGCRTMAVLGVRVVGVPEAVAAVASGEVGDPVPPVEITVEPPPERVPGPTSMDFSGITVAVAVAT